MKKIPSLFVRKIESDRTRNSLVCDEVTEGCEWVAAGDGWATRKIDGSCCLIRDGLLFKRYEVKKGKLPPDGFEPACDVDPGTGKQQGWMRVSLVRPENQWHREAWDRLGSGCDGTYELIGPKLQGNPEKMDVHTLIPHAGCFEYGDCPRTFDALKSWLEPMDIEGIVWHHIDGRMAKIKKKDFGLER